MSARYSRRGRRPSGVPNHYTLISATSHVLYRQYAFARNVGDISCRGFLTPHTPLVLMATPAARTSITSPGPFIPALSSLYTMSETSNRQSQLVGVIGPAGFGGSYLTAELIRRGHTVVGISRNPQSFGAHEQYRPRPLDIEASTVIQLADAFSDLDTLVSEYGPHTQGADALQYSTQAISPPSYLSVGCPVVL
jgi:hypothetical protein